MSAAFLSHSSADDLYVAELEQFVRGLNYRTVFNDVHSVAPFDEFWPSIVRGIDAADVFVVVLSHESVKSRWVTDETAYAHARGKTILPVRVDDCPLPPLFADRDVIDLRPKRRAERKVAASKLTRHAARTFVGREDELKLLDDAWADAGTNVLSVVAWGGVGKTALVSRWVNTRFAARQWPGVERYFDWSFYSQGSGDSRQTSADLFVSAALTFFGDPDPTVGTPWERGERLAGLVRQHRTLLVLDGIEPLQYPPTDRSGQAGRLKDPALEALLLNLAQDGNGLCLVTTREHLTDIDGCATQREHKLERLSLEAATALVRHLDLVGTDGEVAEMWEQLDGHALSVLQLGRLLARAYGRDVRRWREIGFEEADRLTQGRSTMRVMERYDAWLGSGGGDRQLELAVLRLMGLFDRPMAPDCFRALRKKPVIPGLTDPFEKASEAELEAAISTLVENDLLSHGGDPDSPGRHLDHPLDAHPLIREYFGRQLRETKKKAFREAHDRLFRHLCKTTERRPDTLEGLAPLYQAIVHGCLAGRHQDALDDVYVKRILRGTGESGFYSRKKLGAVGADLAALAAFFDAPWGRPSPRLADHDRTWVFHEAAYYLQVNGRPADAVEPLRGAHERTVQAGHWSRAAVSGSNLSQLEVTLGRLRDGLATAHLAADYAERSGDNFQKMANCATLANALHLLGDRPQALALFAQAERMQIAREPHSPLLYSVQGVWYADLLLTSAERCAWRAFLSSGGTSGPPEEEACAEAERRGEQSIQWRKRNGHVLLGHGLDQLTVARSRLYRALLGATTLPDPSRPVAECATALATLRAANNLDELPRALLTAALHAGALLGQPDEAGKFLDEAERIARRGPMPLYQADVHLHRARLFRDKAELAKAGTLIRELGYGRRNEELADAEDASAGW